jgi:hypothetical protein
MVSVVGASAGLAVAAFLQVGLVVVAAVPAAEVHFEAERSERFVRQVESDSRVVAAQRSPRQVILHTGSTQRSF